MKKSAKQAQSIVGTSEGRPQNDFYPTPEPVTLALLSVEKPPLEVPIWEAACGDGAISKVLKSSGYTVFSTDKYDHGYGYKGLDFLTVKSPLSPFLVTNPPFNIINQFIQHANDIGVSYMALLGKLALLEGYERSFILSKTGLKRVYVFRRRITMGRNGEKYQNSGMIAFAWFVWDKWATNKKPEIDWIDAIDLNQNQMKLF